MRKDRSHSESVSYDALRWVRVRKDITYVQTAIFPHHSLSHKNKEKRGQPNWLTEEEPKMQNHKELQWHKTQINNNKVNSSHLFIY